MGFWHCLRISHQGGDGMPNLQGRLEKLESYPTGGADDLKLHGQNLSVKNRKIDSKVMLIAKVYQNFS
jgi:hypothetical protein